MEIDSITDISKRQRRMVELNAQEQALNVYKQAVVQRRRVYTVRDSPPRFSKGSHTPAQGNRL